MYEYSDRKAAGRRHSALILAIGLHIALAAALYFASTGNGVNKPLTTPNSVEDNTPVPQPKMVRLP